MRIKRIAGTVICCMLVVGAYLLGMSGSVDRADRDLPIGQMAERVQEETLFEQTIYYTGCKEAETIRAKASQKVVGMTRDEVADLYNEWQIVSFDRDAVVLKLSVDDVCKAHKEDRFVGLHDGQAAIYYGKPNENPILKEILPIDVAALVPQVQEELAKGIPFHSEEEKLRILEGIQAR